MILSTKHEKQSRQPRKRPWRAAGRVGSSSIRADRDQAEGICVNVLDDIVAGVRADLADRPASVGLDELKAKGAKVAAGRDGYTLLRGPGVGVIAEVWRSSLSKASLAAARDPAALGRDSQASGEAVI